MRSTQLIGILMGAFIFGVSAMANAVGWDKFLYDDTNCSHTLGQCRIPNTGDHPTSTITSVFVNVKNNNAASFMVSSFRGCGRSIA